MHHSTEEANKLVNGFCNRNNALFVSQNSQETNESLNGDISHTNGIDIDNDNDNGISEEDSIKKDIHYQECISSDLLKQIESNSPIRNEKLTQIKNDHSKFFIQKSEDNHWSIKANGHCPSFFPKKANLWKTGSRSGNELPPILCPVIHDRQFAIPNERYVPQGIPPRAYLTPTLQCVPFSNFNERHFWMCIMCKAMNSDMKNHCYRCNYIKVIPLNCDQRKDVPIQVPSQNNANTNINIKANVNSNVNANSNVNEGTAINLTLREIAQINQMQFNQLKKINQLKELQLNEKEKKYDTPVLSSNLKETFDSRIGIGEKGSINSNSKTKRKKKPFAERAGDWVCVKCKNLNFSFRSACNRCNISKSENDKLYEQYMNNLLNYCKVNDILQLKYSSPNTSFPQWISAKDTKDNEDITRSVSQQGTNKADHYNNDSKDN